MLGCVSFCKSKFINLKFLQFITASNQKLMWRSVVDTISVVWVPLLTLVTFWPICETIQPEWVHVSTEFSDGILLWTDRRALFHDLSSWFDLMGDWWLVDGGAISSMEISYLTALPTPCRSPWLALLLGTSWLVDQQVPQSYRFHNRGHFTSFPTETVRVTTPVVRGWALVTQ